MSISDEIRIEKASIKDIDEIYTLEQLCFKEEAFSKKQFNYLVTKANGELVVVRKKGKIIAYMMVLKRRTSKSNRIYSLAVLPGERGSGVGKLLLDYALKITQKDKKQYLTLEVSKNNKPAIDLYFRFGFKSAGIKRRYYADKSDALILKMDVKRGCPKSCSY